MSENKRVDGVMTMTRNLTAFWLLALVLTAAGLAGCNTTAGVGRDIEATGDFIEDSAEGAKH
jgi:predicted small secreted protein